MRDNPDDKELRAAIQRTTEAMRERGKIDIIEVSTQAITNFWTARPLVLDFRYKLVRAAHADEGWLKSLMTRKKVSDENSYRSHLAECEKCRLLLASAIEQIADPTKSRQT